MRKRFVLSISRRHTLEGYGFVLPWIVGFFAFMFVPLLRSLLFAFQEIKLDARGLSSEWVGVRHFRYAFTVDVQFLPLLGDLALSMFVKLPLIIVFAVFIALLLNRDMKGRLLFRGIFFLPVIVASGAVLSKLMTTGAAQLPLFRNPDTMVLLYQYVDRDILVPLLEWADALTLVMWDSGVQILIFIAGLQTISPSLYEAATCDGATAWESFWKITFPMIVPMIFVNVLFTIVHSFTSVNNEMVKHIKDMFFEQNNFGYSAAIGWIYFLFIFTLLAIVMLIFRRGLRQADARG